VTDHAYEIVVTGPAARAIRETLPEAVAFAVIEFITGPLLENPRRIGAPLRGVLEDIWSARRGTYRVLYRIDDEHREVIVLRVAHRRDVYRAD
jgi:mRNA interferase RelE/StbE